MASENIAFYEAVRRRDVIGLRSLLRSQPPAAGSNAVFALQRAIEHGFDEIVDVYLSEGVQPDIRGEAGGTSLMWAAAVGNAGLTNRLIAAGADVNATDIFGMTALHYGAKGQALEVVRSLVTAGADVSRRNREGQLALDLARLGTFSVNVPLIGPGSGVYRRLRDTEVAKYLRELEPRER